MDLLICRKYPVLVSLSLCLSSAMICARLQLFLYRRPKKDGQAILGQKFRGVANQNRLMQATGLNSAKHPQFLKEKHGHSEIGHSLPTIAQETLLQTPFLTLLIHSIGIVHPSLHSVSCSPGLCIGESV